MRLDLDDPQDVVTTLEAIVSNAQQIYRAALRSGNAAGTALAHLQRAERLLAQARQDMERA